MGTAYCRAVREGAAVPTEMEIRALDFSVDVTSNEVLARGRIAGVTRRVCFACSR